MSKAYDDPRFGVEQCLTSGLLGAQNGTNAAAANLMVWNVDKAMVLNGARIAYLVGGTAATMNFILSQSLAGTGAATALGTANYGTAADLSQKSWSVTGTFAAGDTIILSRAAGTATAVYNPVISLYVQETFA